MSDINWNDCSVCHALGWQWVYDKAKLNLNNLSGTVRSFEMLFNDKSFYLNIIREGDYIPASELDTEQKYNEVVEVFGLFGFEFEVKECDFVGYNYIIDENCKHLKVNSNGYLVSSYSGNRKLTHSQIIAIGKLKRMMLEREKSAPEKAPDLTLDKNKSAVDYLTECVEVQKQRGEQYDSTGTGERSFDAAAKAYNALTGGNLKGSDICLILTCVKAVRQYSNPNRLHEDSLLDLVSYASLWAEELNKELK